MIRFKVKYYRFQRQITWTLRENPRFWYFVVGLYMVTFFLVLPLLCNDWAYSAYMMKSSWGWSVNTLAERAMHINGNETLKAREYIVGLPNDTLKWYKHLLDKPSVDIAIGVITVKRTLGPAPLGYLTQVIAGLDKAVRNDNLFGTKALFICNTYSGPGPHWEAETLSGLFPMKMRFPNESVSASIMDRFEKEKQDYVFCLKEAMKTSPNYVMMVEDDALPHFHLLPVMDKILCRIKEKQNESPWAYMKLYYPERWQGYATEPQRIFELISLGILGGMLSLFLLSCFQGQQIKKPLLKKAFWSGALYFCLVAVVVGRPYLLELRRISHHLYATSHAPDCCSPSILYPASFVPKIIKHLNSTVCHNHFGIDMALDEFAHKTGLRRYLVEPNLFKHIGFISTIKGVSQSPEQFIYR